VGAAAAAALGPPPPAAAGCAISLVVAMSTREHGRKSDLSTGNQ